MSKKYPEDHQEIMDKENIDLKHGKNITKSWKAQRRTRNEFERFETNARPHG